MTAARFCRVAAICLSIMCLPNAAWATIPATFLSDLFSPDSVEAMKPLNGGLWVATSTGETSRIWFSDSTRAGTLPIMDVPQLREWHMPACYVTGNKVYFVVGWIESKMPTVLWVSDGTALGTQRLIQGHVVFIGGTAGMAFYSGDELFIFRSNGTVPGTFTIAQTALPGHSSFSEPFNNIFYWTMNTDGAGIGLWRTDGTQSGTWLVKTLDTGETPTLSQPFAWHDKLYFSIKECEFYVSDGTAGGTQLVKDFPQEARAPALLHPVPLESWIFLWATDGSHGVEPWRSDGTTEGTVMLKDICPGLCYTPSHFVTLGDTVYFTASDVTHGNQLWKSDGSEEGTVAIADLSFEPVLSYGLLNETGGYVYFSRIETVGETEIFSLYRVNNSSAPSLVTTLTQNIPQGIEVWTFGDDVYFGGGDKLYRVNGTTAERVILEDSQAGMTGYGHCYLEPVLSNGYLYICGDGLWVLDTLNFRFTETPHPQKREIGDSLLLRVACRSTAGGLTYQWVKDTFEIPDANSPTYQVEELTEDDEGWYSCRVTDASKAVHETTPVFIEVFPTGTLPAATTPTLCLMALACTLWGVRRICRKQ